MRAYAIDQFGETGSIHELPEPTPSEGQVRVRIQAAAVNPVDIPMIKGFFKDMMEHRFPLVPGLDLGGVVDAVGPGVEGLQVGDPVFGAHGKMLVGEVKPFIEKTYRTLPGPENTGMGGSSLGGLVTLHLGIQYPQVFGKLAVLSPSVWWDSKFILREIEQLPSKPSLKIWLDMGTAEGGMSLEDTEMLRDAMSAKGWQVGRDLAYSEVKGATHSETAWAARVGPFLRFLFPAN